MRRGSIAAAALAFALLVAAPGGAASAPPAEVQWMTVSTSPQTAGAPHPRLTILLSYSMQCGYPGAGPLVVIFPSAVKLPKRFAFGSVKLNEKAIAVTRSGHKVTVTIPPPSGVLCGTVGPSLVELTFTHTAKLRNPAHAGSYLFTATHLQHTSSSRLVVKPAA